MKQVTTEQAFKELVENGFSISMQTSNEFLVIDNGKFGFYNDEDPFIVDGDDIIDIYQKYILEKL
jgi:hypothetical protein